MQREAAAHECESVADPDVDDWNVLDLRVVLAEIERRMGTGPADERGIGTAALRQDG